MEDTTVLYFYNGKYYTLRREVKSGHQYFITLIEVEEDGNDN
jgi:hypothetical protein